MYLPVFFIIDCLAARPVSSLHCPTFLGFRLRYGIYLSVHLRHVHAHMYIHIHNHIHTHGPTITTITIIIIIWTEKIQKARHVVFSSCCCCTTSSARRSPTKPRTIRSSCQ